MQSVIIYFLKAIITAICINMVMSNILPTQFKITHTDKDTYINMRTQSQGGHW